VAQFLETHDVPQCTECGGMLKHATVSFGQQLPEDILTEATARAGRSDLFLAIGSSLVVEPAASLPRLARRGGARLIIVNRDETGQDDLADVVLHTSIGDTLTEIDRLLASD
jgi:NAD-dependent deacetylase